MLLTISVPGSSIHIATVTPDKLDSENSRLCTGHEISGAFFYKLTVGKRL